MSSSERPYRTLRELVHAHRGRPAVVMGGGPSLPGEIELCPGRDQAVYISANDHGAKLVGCDYIVAHDKVEEKLRPFGVPVISRHLFADIRYLTFPIANSGVIAAWVAAMMGCAPIHITGMDCWSGGTYWHDEGAQSAGHLLKPSVHLERWRHLMTVAPADYRPMGGLLREAVCRWKIRMPSEPIAKEECLRSVAGVVVRIVQDAPLKTRALRAGEVIEVTQRESERLLGARQAVLA